MLLAFLLAAAVPSPPACPMERAVYRLHGAPTFTAGFARHDRRNAYASDLAFWVKTPQRTYWFAFGSPNGYGGTFIAPPSTRGVRRGWATTGCTRPWSG